MITRSRGNTPWRNDTSRAFGSDGGRWDLAAVLLEPRPDETGARPAPAFIFRAPGPEVYRRLRWLAGSSVYLAGDRLMTEER